MPCSFSSVGIPLPSDMGKKTVLGGIWAFLHSNIHFVPSLYTCSLRFLRGGYFFIFFFKVTHTQKSCTKHPDAVEQLIILSQLFSHISLLPGNMYHGQYSRVALAIALQATTYFLSHFSVKHRLFKSFAIF